MTEKQLEKISKKVFDYLCRLKSSELASLVMSLMTDEDLKDYYNTHVKSN